MDKSKVEAKLWLVEGFKRSEVKGGKVSLQDSGQYEHSENILDPVPLLK